ncbi:MAG: hypothetical protein RL436_263 [Actinomycetota bacterium]|jgi:hypothetical protein
MTIIQPVKSEHVSNQTKLYLVPSVDKEFGPEWFHPKFSPMPSALVDLPELHQWSESFVIKVLEVWSGRRALSQLSRNCHRSVLKKINEQMSTLTQKCQIRKFYFHQPIEGVVEVTVTLRVIDRVRSLILRFEGVDKRWICTELTLL